MEPEIGTSRSMEVEVQDGKYLSKFGLLCLISFKECSLSEMETDNVTSRSLDIKVDDGKKL